MAIQCDWRRKLGRRMLLSKSSKSKLARRAKNFLAGVVVLCLGGAFVHSANVDPQLIAKGLARAAKQKDAKYEMVAPDDVAKCTGSYENRNGIRGLLISGPNGQPLRWLADTNGDSKIDQLSYFQDGVEVYRDIDSDFNDKIDQFRWLGTAGLRWGVDSDEDGVIDLWKVISAEEATSEVVDAIRERDVKRFSRLMVAPSELDALGLGADKKASLTTKMATIEAEFTKFVTAQKVIDKASRWVNFGADKPGVVPAGTDGSTADITAYENVMAAVETAAGPQQLVVGTLVKVGDSWRVMDVPRLAGEGGAVSENGMFFASTMTNRANSMGASSAVTEAMEKLLKELDSIEVKLQSSNSDKAALHDERVSVLQKIISISTTPEDTQTWIRNLADQTLAAVQMGQFPNGLDRLRQFEADVAKAPKTQSEAAYVAYRLIEAEYNVALSEMKKDSDLEKIQADFDSKLEAFIVANPKSMDSVDAMLKLGINSELTQDFKKASEWYKQAEAGFPNTLQGEKAHGALLRLALPGKEVAFSGKTIDGKQFDTSKLNRTVLVHYWASSCSPCKADMKELQRLNAKYGNKGLAIVGVNLDTDRKVAAEFVAANKGIDWPHLWEEGGQDSRIAVGLGVLSIPVTIVIDKNGKVAASTSHYTPDLEGLIEDLLKAPAKK